jgi:hypothetical protein
MYGDSSAWLKRATEGRPWSVEAYLPLGDAYAKLNRRVEACDAYKDYLVRQSALESDVKKRLRQYFDLVPNTKPCTDVSWRLDNLPPPFTPGP